MRKITVSVKWFLVFFVNSYHPSLTETRSSQAIKEGLSDGGICPYHSIIPSLPLLNYWCDLSEMTLPQGRVIKTC